MSHVYNKYIFTIINLFFSGTRVVKWMNKDNDAPQGEMAPWKYVFFLAVRSPRF